MITKIDNVKKHRIYLYKDIGLCLYSSMVSEEDEIYQFYFVITNLECNDIDDFLDRGTHTGDKITK